MLLCYNVIVRGTIDSELDVEMIECCEEVMQKLTFSICNTNLGSAHNLTPSCFKGCLDYKPLLDIVMLLHQHHIFFGVHL